jgi:hypothetical protein
VDQDIHDEWWQWMKTVHLPEVLQTGRFLNCRVFRIHSHDAGMEGINYAIQYSAKTIQAYESYLANEAPILKKKTYERYGEKVLAFRTVLEFVDEIKP